MGEQPTFVAQAHVFQIDPATKKNWMPCSNGAVNVSFYYDNTRNAYRIICVEGAKRDIKSEEGCEALAIINSTLTANMSFTKTSQKFGQWSDTRANTVYGLGFASEAELNKFADKFAETKKRGSKLLPSAASANGDGVDGRVLTVNTDLVIDKSAAEDAKPPVDQTYASVHPSSPSDSSRVSLLATAAPPQVVTGAVISADASQQQLKYENDRLKIALAQSSQNAKKWEVELQTLKNNNARLTAALQESTANVEEWKKQLAAYKEENAKLKKKLSEQEKNSTESDELMLLRGQLGDVTARLQAAEEERRKKEDETRSIITRMHLLEISEAEKNGLQERLVAMEQEHKLLKNKLDLTSEEVDVLRSTSSEEKASLRRLHDALALKLGDLSAIQNQLGKLLQL